MRYKYINFGYVKNILNNQYIGHIVMGLDEYLPSFQNQPIFFTDIAQDY